VILLTTITMVVEIVVGIMTNSMALLADGWHMGTHAAALGITAFAYAYARRHKDDPRYTFGTGKVGVLGGFTSAVVLGVVALLVASESLHRLYQPLTIRFNEALAVAVLGLIVNLVSAWLLTDHHHATEELGGQAHHHHDHNLRGAYLHVMADALTSVLAIAALIAGKSLGWVWMDPAIGILGAVFIARWSWGLMRDTGDILLDGAVDPEKIQSIKKEIESDTDNRVSDLHVWRVGPRHLAAVISIVSHTPNPPEYYKALLEGHRELAHVTVEVHRCGDDLCEPS
ncbi:MAG: CDF family Co(II)/Ni(II) efflux transporter DmeF, partial [Gammaproteobacteria bacterium]|nr:CDF family Co(II)/Ni(II) efflux transporter DmeF [Gammaproteobacteria bacterium]